MERIEQLENAIMTLLEKTGRLSAEVSRLNSEAEAFATERAALEAENRQLKEALSLQVQKRETVVQRIDTLLRLIQEQENIV